MHNSIIRGLIACTILASLGGPPTASAQPLTRSSEPPPHGSFLGLQGAIELALQSHPAIQEGNANLKASEARTQQTRSLYYPQVSASADTTAGAGRPNPRFLVGGALLQQNQSIFVAGVIANQRIYDFGVTSNLVESSQLAERAQGQDVNARRALAPDVFFHQAELIHGHVEFLVPGVNQADEFGFPAVDGQFYHALVVRHAVVAVHGQVPGF